MIGAKKAERRLLIGQSQLYNGSINKPCGWAKEKQDIVNDLKLSGDVEDSQYIPFDNNTANFQLQIKGRDNCKATLTILSNFFLIINVPYRTIGNYYFEITRLWKVAYDDIVDNLSDTLLSFKQSKQFNNQGIYSEKKTVVVDLAAC